MTMLHGPSPVDVDVQVDPVVRRAVKWGPAPSGAADSSISRVAASTLSIGIGAGLTETVRFYASGIDIGFNGYAMGQTIGSPDTYVHRGLSGGVEIDDSGGVGSYGLFMARYIGSFQKYADSLPVSVLYKSQDAYDSATGANRNGADTVLSAGIGQWVVTVANFAALAGKTVTYVANGVTTVLTEGVDWTAATSNAATATSIRAALVASGSVIAAANVLGAGVIGAVGTETVYTLTITSNDAVNLPVTHPGTNGSVVVQAPTVIWRQATRSTLDLRSTISPDGGYMLRIYHYASTVDPRIYINDAGGHYTVNAITISGTTSGTGAGFNIDPPSTDPYMLGTYSDIDGPNTQHRCQNSAVLTHARVFDGLDHLGNHTFSIGEFGKLSWGVTTYAAQDTFLSRASAGVLYVDDGAGTGSLTVGFRVTVGNIFLTSNVVVKASASVGGFRVVESGFNNLTDQGFAGAAFVVCDPAVSESVWGIVTGDAAGVLAQKNGAVAQTYRVYGNTTGSKYTAVAHDGTDGQISTTAGDLYLNPTGNVKFGTFTANLAVVLAGYITIKDAGGTSRKLAVFT